MYKFKIYGLSFLVCIVAFFLLKNCHFSLTYYFAIVTVYMLLMSTLCRQAKVSKGEEINYSPIAMITTYMSVALMSIMVYVNYYEGRGGIYNNVDHHALALKGFQVSPTGILYGRGNDAILQDTATIGQLSWQMALNADGKVDSVILQANGLHRSLFVRRAGHETAYNANAALDSMPHDGYLFRNNSLRRDLRLQIIEEPHSTWSISPASDRALYVFTVSSSDSSEHVIWCDTSSIHYFIQKSLPLNTLIPSQVVAEFGNDLAGYQLTRERYRTAEGPYTLNNYAPYLRWAARFHHKSYRDQKYLLEQTRQDETATLINRHQSNEAQRVTLYPGDYFFIGFGTNGTQPMTFNEKGQLLFDLPQYKPLPNEKEQTEMIVTSSNNAICHRNNPIEYNILYNVQQIDANKRENGNNHLFNAEMTFVRGSTEDSIQMMINHHTLVNAGKEFTIDCQHASNVQAVMQLTDFKGTSLFQPKPLLRTILLMFLLASIMAVLTRYHKSKNNNSKPKRIGTTTEMACIVLLFVLFTTRYILCWRLSSFPPIENVTRLEFLSFIQNADVFNHLTKYLPFVLFMGVLVKAAVYVYRKKWDDDMPRPALFEKIKKPSWLRWALLLPPALAIVEFVSLMFIPRGFQVLLPVATYFIIEMLFVLIYVEKVYEYIYQQLPIEERKGYAFSNLRFNFRFPFVLNYAVHLGLLFLLDAGFGIMFMLYGMVRYYLVYIRYLNYQTKNKLWWWAAAIFGLTLILALFYFMPNLLALLMNSPVLGNIAIIIIMAAVIGLFVWLFRELFFTKPSAKANPLLAISPVKRRTIITIALGAIAISTVVALSTGLYGKVLGPDGHFTHIRYRTKVLVEDWDKTLNNERVSDGKKITRFRQASENQWILDYYYNHRPTGNDTYFKLLPMNKTGAMWGAQSTDLSFLRFGIAEHGMSYAAWLFLLMLAVFIIAMRQPVDPEKAHLLAWRSIAIGALLLILMQSIFVWMSVTNRFIFFGQDFPMLSITSKMTIYYVLFLLLLASILSRPHDTSTEPAFNKNERKFAVTFAVIMVLFCVTIHFVVGENRKNKNQDAYLLKLDHVEKVMYAHNKLLKYYQIQANGMYNRVILGNNNGRNNAGKALMRDFNNNIYLGVESEEDNSPSQRASSYDCLLLINGEGKQFPYIPDGNKLYNPLMDLLNARKTNTGAYLAMASDNVTLEIRFPQDSLFNSEERQLVNTINELFFDYQVQSRSLHLAKLRNKSLRAANVKALNENRSMLQSGDFTSFINDYIAYVDSGANSDNAALKSLIAKARDESVTGATFTNSLVEAYAESYSKHNSPYNIIYLKRDRSTGYLQFYINKDYFSIPVMGDAAWRGSIIAKDAASNELLLTSSTGHNVSGTYYNNDHFTLARIPASWLMGENDQIIFRANEQISISRGLNQLDTLPHDGITTIKFDKNTGADIIESGGTVRVSLPDNNYHVFAKNVWINGHRNYIYPLGECFFWARPYSNYVTMVMSDSVAMAPQAVFENHMVSLDYDLTENLYQFMESINQGLSPNRQHNLSVFVGNSDGEIVAMPDYHENPLYHVDPNDWRQINRLQQYSYLFADYSDDRGLNGNFNLQPVLYGPGSSLKPLTFGAVASTVREDWENFRLVGSIPDNLIIDGVTRYAGKKFKDKETFKSVFGDEPRIGEEFDVTKYLYKSSNFFNSVVTFLGSFSEATLQNGVFKNANGDFSRYGINEFPVVRRGGRLQSFSTIFRPQGADAEPVLMKRFLGNYGVYAEPTGVNRAYLNDNTLDPLLRATSLHYFEMIEPDAKKRRWMVPYEGWVVPEPSFIDFPSRADSLELSYAMQIKSFSLGMRRLINVSPLKMGEMFSRLFMLDKNFKFRVSGPITASKVDYEAPAYRNTGEFLNMLQGPHSFYQGLHRCAMPEGNEVIDGMQMHYIGGTARYLNRIQLPQGLYVYAKTGTINRDKNSNGQTGLLAVIITNGDMRHARIQNDQIYVGGHPLKFYVIYMFMDKISGNRKQLFQTGTVERVIQSPRFREFFNVSVNQ